MKTMEQKARAYDEAVTKSIEFYTLCKKCGAKDAADFLESIFPELVESEDERIRKELKHYLEVKRCQTKDNEEYINCNHFLAWLEKQGKKEVDPRYENLEELLAADDIYQMAMNDKMVEEAKSKAMKALSKLEISKLLGIEK